MKKLLLVLFAFAALACSKDHSSGDLDAPLKKGELSYVMSLDSVRALALKLPSTFSDNPQTKSSGKLIKEIVPFTRFKNAVPKTRSVDSNAPSLDDVYVVNYENGEGFAIICADRRLPDVLGYSDSGSISDTLSNPGMGMVMELIPGFVATRGVNYPPIIIDTTHKWLELYPYDSYGQWENNGAEVVAKVNVSWGQDPPFNDKHPSCDWYLKKKTGCSATAIVQIMSYHKNLNSVNNVAIDWNDLSSRRYSTNFSYGPSPYPIPINQISTLMKYAGDKMGTQYGCDESGTNNGNVVNSLHFFNLKSDGLVNYTAALVKQNINNGRPVYMTGKPASLKGHAWVIDEYREQVRAITHYEPLVPTVQFAQPWYAETVTYEYRTLLWCNWGWNGNANGYFLSTLFKTTQGIDYELDPVSNPIQTDALYSIEMKIINNLRPL